MPELRVLFLHALESRPGTLKHKYLEAYFDTQCPYLRSPIWMQRLRLVLACEVLFGLVTIVGMWVAFFLRPKVMKLWMALAGTVVVVLFAWGLFVVIKRYMLRTALTEATAIADEAYKIFQPHVIVSASFGSVVAVNMEQTKTPHVMLGPAIQLYYSHAGIDKPPDLSAYPFVTICHGSEDSTVPLQDSLRLHESTRYNCQVEIITGGDHRLSCFTEEELREYVHATLFKADPKMGGAEYHSNFDTPPSNPSPRVAVRAAMGDDVDPSSEPLLAADRQAAMAAWQARGQRARSEQRKSEPQPEPEEDGSIV